MRKLLAIALLGVFGLAFVAPLVSWAVPEQTRLPSCCRRGGAHHCTLNMASSAGESGVTDDRPPRLTGVPDRCPFAPATVTAAHGELAGSPAAVLAFATPASHPAGPVQTECRRRIARDRARQKRGPPVFALAA